MAGFPGGGLLRLFQRILCVTGGIIGVWFVAALLSTGGATAHAADLPVAPAPLALATDASVEIPVDASSDQSVVAAGESLQASPSAISESANRRAVIERAVADAGLASLPVADVASSVVPLAHTEPSAPEPTAPLSLTPPVLPLGTPDHRADSGPSGAQLAVITAALMAVVWLTQQLHSDAYRWRSVRVSTRIERPG